MNKLNRLFIKGTGIFLLLFSIFNIARCIESKEFGMALLFLLLVALAIVLITTEHPDYKK